MPIKISVKDAVTRYGVTQRTIYRWADQHEIYQFDDGSYDRDQLDALTDEYSNPEFTEVDWDRAACNSLPTNFFYRIEDRGMTKIIDLDVFRFTCTPCPIWRSCLGYAIKKEEYGVWGGMTSSERQVMVGEKSSHSQKIIDDFARFGVSEEVLMQAIGKS